MAELEQDTITSLEKLGRGEGGVVKKLEGGQGFLGRLSVLGFTPGAEVRMLENYGHGPVIVLVRGTRIALGRGQVSEYWAAGGGWRLRRATGQCGFILV